MVDEHVPHAAVTEHLEVLRVLVHVEDDPDVLLVDEVLEVDDAPAVDDGHGRLVHERERRARAAGQDRDRIGLVELGERGVPLADLVQVHPGVGEVDGDPDAAGRGRDDLRLPARDLVAGPTGAQCITQHPSRGPEIASHRHRLHSISRTAAGVQHARIVTNMASFTFGSGNARKLLRLPLYALGALTTLLVPRSGRRWAFGSGIGLGEGSLALYREARERLDPDIRLVWLATTDAELAEARELGLEAVAKHSARGFWTTLRSRVLVVTHGFGDVNRYATRGGFVVQLWHGIPLKKLHLDSPAALRVSFLPNHRLVRGLIARAYRFAGRGIALFPVASELVAPRIASAFGVPRDRIVVTGDPRDDVLLAGDPATRRDEARRALGEALGGGPLGASRLVLYAPTWRDGAADPGIPNAAEWDAIAAWLERTDAVLLIRTHPLGLGDYVPGTRRSDRIRMLPVDRLADVNPVLAGIDALVTDYSSIAYDYALVGAREVGARSSSSPPTSSCTRRRRGLYENYRDFSGDRHVTSWEHVLVLLDEAGTASENRRAIARHVAWLRNEHFDHLDGGRNRAGAGRDRPHAPALRSPRRHRAVPTPRPRVVGITVVDGPVPQLTVELDTGDREVGGGDPRGRARAGRRSRRDRGNGDHRHLPAAGDALGHPGSRPAVRRLPVHARAALRPPRGSRSTQPSCRASVPRCSMPTCSRARAASSSASPRRSTTMSAGRRPSARLERAYRRSRPTPADAVFFESFYGQSASVQPARRSTAALARMRPDVARYWSVVDGSVAIPDGAIAHHRGQPRVVAGPGSARVLVVNDWLRKRFRRRREQHVLQTWHGTMLKRLALDRGGRGLRTSIAVLRERARWDAMLAQNAYSTRIFRSAYAFDGPIWEDGYPRNDVFAMPERIAEVKRRIGVPEAPRVVLYAPTWRDDRTEMVDYVDLTSFVGELGDDHVLLVRGHSRTLRYGSDLEAAGLIDVTSYPNMADMLLIADVLVTDYSSVMFDFAATGRPMVFFTPDLAHYSEDLRGFYFDLLAEAPGPVVQTRDELRDAILEAEAHRPGFEARAPGLG